MSNIYNVDPNELIEAAAKKLAEQSIVKPPAWAPYTKTGMHKERPPERSDWWYLRAAALLRSVYRLGPIGTSKLRKKYGGRKNRGYRPEHFYPGSGAIIRKALQQLEQAGFLKQVEKGVHKGRILTPKGKSFLDKIAVELAKKRPRPERPKREQPAAEEVQKGEAEKPKKPRAPARKKKAEETAAPAAIPPEAATQEKEAATQ